MDGRDNTGSLEEALTSVDGTVVGYVPWKAMEVHYRTIKHKRDFLQNTRLKIEELW